MKNLSSNFSSKEYIRVFVKVAEGTAFIKNYLKNFDAEVEYVFDMPKLGNLRVVALTSPHGNISAVITDSLEGFPEYLERTKVLYWTKDMESTLRNAEAAGMKVLQEKSAVPMGFQGRYETPGGYVVELAEVSEEGKQYFHQDLEKLGYTL
ncbi:hypothetical protein [Flammeovirga kamogawensis]|uniref:VOC family protein n=1 Tax=Flammeovirga kamogawensis TaxID=373891 RepID=A0ABX8GVU0_9BACT|nr:hypothetical protein [Flammeovirga kamogawensis]MBB6459671.1 putative enzyme related to lactoylglutathione lyase [Flammeovirga kamogawensis]QWG07267.1 hypothetical protein KM029_18485 [Flammeovirga kamogawensis]TRX69087.1 hypothetical protein EO216_13475 [Flammeovirga kamogawensis]